MTTTDYYFARQRVLEKLVDRPDEMPPGVTPYLAADATAVGQIFWYTVEGEGKEPERAAVDPGLVRPLPAQQRAGRGRGGLGRRRAREYQIDLDPNKLRAYGISLGEVYSAVARSNSSVGGRVIHQGNAEYLIRSVGWIENLDDIRETVVAQRKQRDADPRRRCWAPSRSARRSAAACWRRTARRSSAASC